MKKTLIRICSIAAIGLALSACNNDAANKTAMDADNSAIDQMVQDKVKTLDDSLAKVCDDQVTAAAVAKIEEEGAHKGSGHAAHHGAATPAPVKKEEPKAPQGGLKGKSDQSNTTGGGLKGKSDQANTSNPAGGGLRGKRDTK